MLNCRPTIDIGRDMITKDSVTGGCGFIGSHVVQALRMRSGRVTVIDDLSTGYQSNVVQDEVTKVLNHTILNPEAVAEAVAGATTVYHLAAAVGNKRSIEDPRFDARVNVMGTLEVLEAMRSADIGSIVYSSSAGIFGELKHLPISEDHPLDPDSPYGVTKLAAEKLCLSYAKLYGIQAVALRYFNVYGPRQRYDQYGNVIPIFVFRLLEGKEVTIYGDGEQTRDFVHAADVAEANVLAGRSGVSGVYNIGSGSRVTINGLVSLLTDLIDGPHRVVYGPPRPGDVRHSLADLTRASSDFGFAPKISLEKGLSEYVEWARGELNGR